MLDQKRIDEIKERVNGAHVEYLSNKDTIREYFSIVTDYYEEVNAWVGNPLIHHSKEAALLYMDLEMRRNELAAELGEEIEQEV